MTLRSLNPMLPVGLGTLGAVGLVVLSLVAPKAVAAGWLTAFVYVSWAPLGSLGWLLVHRLSGGRWGEGLRPLLVPLALCIPGAAILFIPVLFVLPVLFPWAAGTVDLSPSVSALYLNVPLYILRDVIALVGLSILSLLMASERNRAPVPIAAIGLIFYAVTVSYLAVDWVFALERTFMWTSCGYVFTATTLLAGLSVVAVIGRTTIGPRVARDLGGLMLATALGLAYLNFMGILIIWYSDLPNKVFWLVERVAAPWGWLSLATFVLTCAIPICLLLISRLRGSARQLQVVGAIILAGLGCYAAVLVATPFGPAALAGAVLSAITMAGLLGGFAVMLHRIMPGLSGGSAHG